MKKYRWLLGCLSGLLLACATVLPLTAAAQTDFGAVKIGGSATATVMVTFANPTQGNMGPLDRISVLTQGAPNLDFSDAGGGSCKTGKTYAGGATCTVKVTFKPRYAGARYGAITLTQSVPEVGWNGVIATVYLRGSGQGPQTAFLPGRQTTADQKWDNPPLGVAVDVSGNFYVVVYNNNEVYNDGAVFKETLQPNGSYIRSAIGSGWQNPFGVAVDGAGNIYVKDRGLVEEMLQPNGSYAEIDLEFDTDFYSFAVDGSGTIYLSNSEGFVYKEERTAAGYFNQSIVVSGLDGSSGVAVDGSGNIYVAEMAKNLVLKETPSTGAYTQSIVGSGLLLPSGIAVDGVGTVYIADSGHHRVLKEVPSGGGYTQSTVASGVGVSNGYPSPGVAVDARGSVYIADSSNNAVLKVDFADPPSLNFATTVYGSTSSDSPRTVTVENIGIAALTFPVPASGENPSVPEQFVLDSTGKSACPLVGAGASSAGTLAAGASCLLPISFKPSAVGTFTGSLALTDNTLNAIAPNYFLQNIQLSGKGVKATQTLQFVAPPTAVSYGAASISLTATATSGLGVAFTVTGPANLSGSTLTMTGAGTVVVTASQPGNDDYQAAPPISRSIVVSKVVLTVTAVNASRVYGAANPAFADIITGFVHGDTAAGAITGSPNLTSATANTPVGSFPITASAGTLAARNYGFKFVAGTLTITRAMLTVTANNGSRLYGWPNPALTATMTGFANGETAPSAVTGVPGLTTTAVSRSPVGSYPVTVSAGTVTARNYTFNFVPGTLMVTKAMLRVTANNASRVYGAVNPPLTYTIIWFASGDTAANAIAGAPSLSTAASAKSAVNTYPITVSVGTLSAKNYNFQLVAGTFTITPGTLTVTATNASRMYGAANPVFTYTVAGFASGDTLATAATGVPSLSTTATVKSLPGSYPIAVVAGTLAARNYSFLFKNGTLIITPKGTVAAPTFNPAAGTYTTPQSVAIADATPGAVIYYTTDGNAPTTNSTKYTNAIKVSATETFKAVAVAAGYSPSAITSAAYTLK